MAGIFNALGNRPMTGNGNMNIIQRYNEFRKMFKGDPKQIIQQKLQSGEITQQQLEQARSMMSQFSQFMGK